MAEDSMLQQAQELALLAAELDDPGLNDALDELKFRTVEYVAASTRFESAAARVQDLLLARLAVGGVH